MTRTERFNQLYDRYERKATRQIAAGELSWSPEIMKAICTDVAEAHMAYGPGNPVVYDADIATDLPNPPIHPGDQTNYTHASL
jgi:hypothetical protein